MKRCFIAIPLPEEIKNELYFIKEDIKKLYPKAEIKYVAEKESHLTLEFLGEISDEQIEIAKEVINEASQSFSPFVYFLEKVSAFPILEQAKIIIVSLREDGSLGLRVQRFISDKLKAKGLALTDRAFTPHLTLGRVKKEDGLDLSKLLDLKVEPLFFLAKEIVLYESELRLEGPHYTPLFRAEIKAQA